MSKASIYQKFISILFFSFSNFIYASGRAHPLPDSKIIESKFKSIDDVLAKMWVSDTFAVKDSRVEVGVDLAAMEKIQIRNYIDDKSISNNEKMIVMIRYGMGDEEMVELFIEAKQKGIAVLFITDLNQYLKADFAEGEKSTVDFSKAKAVGAMGAIITRLLAAGFDYNDPRWGILSQPLLLKEGDTILPIMHEKALLLLRGQLQSAEVLKLIAGTNNITGHARYNRSIEIAETNLKKLYLEHIQKVVDAFTQGKKISEIENVGRLRTTFKDSSYAELAFTDGKFNPNDRVANIFKEALDSSNKIKVKKVLFSEFVFTHKDTSEALVDLMKLDPELIVSGVFDDRFIDLHGYGQAIRFLGYPLIRDFGGSKLGWGRAISSRSKFWAYQAPAFGSDGKPLDEDSNDGAPTQRKVWHDKTSMVWVTEEGKEWVYIFTLSLNLSSHFDNAEAQLMFKISAESSWVKAFEDSILGVKDLQPEYALPLENAILRNSLAMLADIRDLEVSVEETKNASKMLLERNYSAFKELLVELIDRDSTLSHRLEKNELKERLEKLGSFLDWYLKKVPPSQSYAPQRLQKFALMSLLFSDHKLRAGQKAFVLRQILWRPGVDDAQLEAWLHEAWEAASLDLKDFPKDSDDSKNKGSSETNGAAKDLEEGRATTDAASLHTKNENFAKLLAASDEIKLSDESGATLIPVLRSAKVEVLESLPENSDAALLKLVGMGTIVGDVSDEPSAVNERIFKLKSQSKKWASSFYIFDIDDNLFKLPTKIVVFEKSSGKEVFVSTGEYSKIRQQIGKIGIWKHFEIRGDDKTGSFRYFRPKENGNYFLDDILRALKESSPERWVGPSFETLLSVLTDSELAKKVFFLTARGHDSAEVLEGLDKLLSYYRNKLGVKLYLPSKENIYCIGSVPNPAQAKADRLREIVSRINSMPLDPAAPKVLNAAGSALDSLHLVGFSDDDGLNLKLAEETMSKFLGSMPHVKFTLWDSSRSPALGKVLIPGSFSRPLKPVEFEEFISDLEEQLHDSDAHLKDCEAALESKAS